MNHAPEEGTTGIAGGHSTHGIERGKRPVDVETVQLIEAPHCRPMDAGPVDGLAESGVREEDAAGNENSQFHNSWSGARRSGRFMPVAWT